MKNLNFSTTTQKLSETFKPLAGFRSAVVRTKTDPKRGVLSLGYGFVDFSNSETASAALRAMDGYSLEGHSLKIQASHRGADAAEGRRKEDAAKNAAGTKILIKNLPFEATVCTPLFMMFPVARSNLHLEKRRSRALCPLRIFALGQGAEEVRFVFSWICFRRVLDEA